MPRKSRRACEPTDSLTPVKCVFQPLKISNDSCKACQPFILIDEVFGEWTCRICSRQEYGEKRMKKHVADKHPYLTHHSSLHTCGKLQETNQDATIHIQDDNTNKSKLFESKVEIMNAESIDKNANTEEVIDQDMTSSVQDDKNDESKLSEPEVEPMETESVDKNADTECLEAIELVHDQDPTSLKAKENATSKQEWQIVEITPTKKSFRKTSKSLFKLKNLQQSEVKSSPPISNPEQLNVDLIQSKNLQTSQVHPTSIPNLELFNVDLMESRNLQQSQVNNNVDLIQFKPLTPISPISNLEQFNMDLMHSIQGPQVNHTPVANLGQLNVDLMQPKPVKRSVRMHPTITQPRICPPRVNFSEDVVCQEFSPKEKSENPKKRKTNSSPIGTEKRSKIKSKAWEYDATNLVNKILDTKETRTDENNNPENDNDS